MQSLDQTTFNEVRVQAVDGSSAEVGRVANLFGGNMDVELNEALPASSKVRIEFSTDCIVDGAVLSSKLHDGAYLTRIQLTCGEVAGPIGELLLSVLSGGFSTKQA